ncbi:MAG TPA: xanthine dehydrogenase molybdopterin binding subunit [Geminicoccaceae bacterium]
MPEGTIRGRVQAGVPHDSAAKHASGEALYVDDLPEPAGMLYAAVGLSTHAHAEIVRMNLDAVRAAPGVVAVATAEDVPGNNDVGPVYPGDPLFADGVVEYAGQALFAVAANTVEQARRAARLAEVEYRELEAILTIEAALAKEATVVPSHEMRRGEPEQAIASAPHRLSGHIRMGGQDHFYLEGQVAFAVPTEDGDMLVWSSTQHPSEVQHLIASVLSRPHNAITVEVRRMGGGFGGKETQAAPFACMAALLAHHTKRPVKLRLDRDDDMLLTGKRHEFLIDYDVGFDDEGRIQGIVFEQAARCGFSPDLSAAIADRAMFHADNAYYLPHVRITSHRCKTHTVSNTAFRGFGGPQGMMGIEKVIDAIARERALDPLEVRRRNLYGADGRDVTPYHMRVQDNVLPELIAELAQSSEYAKRREAIRAFNAHSPVLKRGIALTPVKFGISFTVTHLNQAGALLHVYTDGSVHLNHGGTEMGQGLMTKVAQLVAEELQIHLDQVKISATNTGKVPNTSATAASAGADLNGAAALAAARTIKYRLIEFLAAHFMVPPEQVVFRPGEVRIGEHSMSFAKLARLAHQHRVQLSAAGFYRTPKIWYDRARARGRPFYYFAYGAAVSEVVLDTLTGEYRVLRADLLHDVGRSINPAIDLGQIEGGFVQGMGWLTTEELCWNERGELTTHAPSTYKIPTASDLPADFRVRIWEKGVNRENVVGRSKAVGEPPLMLGLSVFHAVNDAIASVAGGRLSPALDAPATPERVLFAIEDLKRRVAATEPAAAQAAE